MLFERSIPFCWLFFSILPAEKRDRMIEKKKTNTIWKNCRGVSLCTCLYTYLSTQWLVSVFNFLVHLLPFWTVWHISKFCLDFFNTAINWGQLKLSIKIRAFLNLKNPFFKLKPNDSSISTVKTRKCSAWRGKSKRNFRYLYNELNHNEKEKKHI